MQQVDDTEPSPVPPISRTPSRWVPRLSVAGVALLFLVACAVVANGAVNVLVFAPNAQIERRLTAGDTVDIAGTRLALTVPRGWSGSSHDPAPISWHAPVFAPGFERQLDQNIYIRRDRVTIAVEVDAQERILRELADSLARDRPNQATLSLTRTPFDAPSWRCVSSETTDSTIVRIFGRDGEGGLPTHISAYTLGAGRVAPSDLQALLVAAFHRRVNE